MLARFVRHLSTLDTISYICLLLLLEYSLCVFRCSGCERRLVLTVYLIVTIVRVALIALDFLYLFLVVTL
jgi:hypothetical protein